MKLVLLDRDGVINEDSTEYIKSASEWKAIPGSLEAIARLCQNGYRIIVISNQAGLARKKLDIIDLNDIHRKMLDHLAQFGGTIDAFFFCPHDPKEHCDCRKPKAGLLKEISERLHIPMDDVPFVGDKMSDIQAAIEVGARPILVKTGYGEETQKNEELPGDIHIFANLAEVADYLIGQ